MHMENNVSQHDNLCTVEKKRGFQIYRRGYRKSGKTQIYDTLPLEQLSTHFDVCCVVTRQY